jgi:hypothetical protein
MAYSRFMDEEVLRRVIQRKLQSGRLPHDGIRTVWSTPGDGETCDACDTVHTRNQLLMEAVLLGLGQRSIRMHVRCTLCYASPVRWRDAWLTTNAMATRSVRER